MQWSEVRRTYPNQWLVIEALEAETQADNRRHLKRLAVIEQCVDGAQAFQCYRRLHQQYPGREFYFAHTSREHLDIREQTWVGIRGGHATVSQG